MGKKLKCKDKSLGNTDALNEILDAVNEDRDEGKELKLKDVKAVVGAYIGIVLGEVQDNGIFVIPGVAKFVRKYKPARPKKKGTNPFTGEPCVFKAKPESYAVKARPLSKLKKAAKNEL